MTKYLESRLVIFLVDGSMRNEVLVVRVLFRYKTLGPSQPSLIIIPFVSHVLRKKAT